MRPAHRAGEDAKSAVPDGRDDRDSRLVRLLALRRQRQRLDTGTIHPPWNGLRPVRVRVGPRVRVSSAGPSQLDACQAAGDRWASRGLRLMLASSAVSPGRWLVRDDSPMTEQANSGRPPSAPAGGAWRCAEIRRGGGESWPLTRCTQTASDSGASVPTFYSLEVRVRPRSIEAVVTTASERLLPEVSTHQRMLRGLHFEQRDEAPGRIRQRRLESDRCPDRQVILMAPSHHDTD
jgi:hypothetical protein